MSLTTAALLIALGAAIGLFGTLVGAGGGFILTPALLLLYPNDNPATITAISMLVVFFNALSGSVAYARQRRIDYRSGIAFALATLPGAIAGAVLVTLAPRRLFDAVMAVLMGALATWLVVGARSVSLSRGVHPGTPRRITDREGTTHRYTVPVARGVAFSVVVGFVSSFLGIGGGVIHVPLLIGALGFPVHIATATSHFVLANMSAVGTVTHLVAGDFPGGTGLHRAAALSIGVLMGAQAGAVLSQRVHGVVIQRLLALALAGLAIRLFFLVAG